MKSLVVYYSNTGNNKFLAEKLADNLKCDLEAIRPRMGSNPLLIFLSILRISFGVKPLLHRPEDYDKLILFGPIWTGKLASPLTDFIKKYEDHIQKLFLATCCASRDEGKYDKYGYGSVFRGLRKRFRKQSIHCAAFPVNLVLPDDKKEDDELIMKTKLSNENFEGEIEKRFNEFIHKIEASNSA